MLSNEVSIIEHIIFNRLMFKNTRCQYELRGVYFGLSGVQDPCAVWEPVKDSKFPQEGSVNAIVAGAARLKDTKIEVSATSKKRRRAKTRFSGLRFINVLKIAQNPFQNII